MSKLTVLLFLPLYLQYASGQSRTDPSAFSDITPREFTFLLVYGSVALADGTPPEQLVLIERVCNGVAQNGGFADSKGHFSFDLGALNKTLSTGSISFDINTNQLASRRVTKDDLEKCEVRATLPGYRSNNLSMAKHSDAQNAELGKIKLEPITRESNPARSESDEQAPKNARKLYDKALDFAARAKWPEAMEAFNKANAMDPKYASALLCIGMLQAGGNAIDAARKSYAAAIAADSRFPLPYLAAAELEAREGDWVKTAELAGKLIDMDPAAYPRAYVLSASANLNLKKLDQMAKIAEAGLVADTEHRYPDLHYFEGIARMTKNDKAGAVSHFQTYLTADPAGANAESARKQLASLPPSTH